MRRPNAAVRLGRQIQPAAITEAWYDQDCQPRIDFELAGIGRRTRIVWRFSCLLRGARMRTS